MGPRATRRKAAVALNDDDEDSDVADASLKQHQSHINGKPNVMAPEPVRKDGLSRHTKTSLASSSKSIPSSPSSRMSKGKARSKNVTPPKPPGKPIYSFFNVATQRQQELRSSVSPEKLTTLHEEIEVIHDDTDEEKQNETIASTKLSQGSSTALAMRKRKFQRTQSFESEIAPPPAASQKFRKVSAGSKVPNLSNTNDTRPWTERFAPNDLIELAVHKRKVADVRGWLQSTLRGRRQKVLVLKGAAGAGKTMTVQLLAKDLGIEVIEWTDLAVSDYGSDTFVSATVRFEEFVGRATRSSGLTLVSSGNSTHPIAESVTDEKSLSADCAQALVIEEFPNTFSKTSSTWDSFRSTIAQYVSTVVPVGSMPTPLIMIISETLLSTNTAAADSFTAHRLLGPELINSPYIHVMDFNPVAPTFLIKALELVVIKEARKSGRRRTPGPQVLQRLAETGDIRSAVSSLEFLCLRGDSDDIWGSKITFTKPKHMKTQPALTKSEDEALRLISGRESSLGIFHSVGKVVYNKRADSTSPEGAVQPPQWLPHHRRGKVPETDADSLLQELGTDVSTFIAALHENYALSCSSARSDGSLDSLLGCMENLSDSDVLSVDRFSFGTRAFSGSATDSLRQDEICFQIAVRGILFSLPHPVHRSAEVGSGNRADAHRMLYPSSLRLWKKKLEVEGKLGLLNSQLVSGQSGIGRTANASPRPGIEGWKRNQPAVKASDELDPPMRSLLESGHEMLVDRLPYMCQILESSSTNKEAQSLLDQVLSVARISGVTSLSDDDADDDGEEIGPTEQWSTDQPDNDSNPAARKARKPAFPSKQKSVFEVASLPVETRVEALVLEDDDIVDD